MPRKKKQPEIEPATEPEALDDLELEIEQEKKQNKRGSAYVSIATKLAQERLTRLKQQNSKLRLDLKKTKGEVGDIEQLKRSVLAANHTVKQQLLALPSRLAPRLVGLSDKGEIIRLLTAALSEALNDLAYENEK